MKNNTNIQGLLSDENEHIRKLHDIVAETLKKEELIVQNLLNPPLEILTAGRSLSAKVAKFGDSWRFIICFGIILTIWIAFNVAAVSQLKSDPYPFILMNLI